MCLGKSFYLYLVYWFVSSCGFSAPPTFFSAHDDKEKKNMENIHKKKCVGTNRRSVELWTLKVVVAIMTTPYCDRPTCWRCVSRCDANEALCEQRPAMVVCSSMLLTWIDWITAARWMAGMDDADCNRNANDGKTCKWPGREADTETELTEARAGSLSHANPCDLLDLWRYCRCKWRLHLTVSAYIHWLCSNASAGSYLVHRWTWMIRNVVHG